MGYIRRHKLAVFVMLVYTIVVGFTFFIYKLFIGSNGNPVYGDRLDGIEKVPITEEQKTKIVDSLKGEKMVLSVTKPYLNGKILKVIITVGDKAEVAASEAYATKVTDVLSDDQKKFYDVEVYITKPYSCTLEATGDMDEEGNFVNDVVVKFSDNLPKNEYVLDYGLTNKKGKKYNKETEFEITKDGEYVIYGYTKDVTGEFDCSIKITKKSIKEGKEVDTREDTVNSVTSRTFPLIGYLKGGMKSFVWTKTK
jgi:hypothetical protein